jgi:hypothetical protein
MREKRVSGNNARNMIENLGKNSDKRMTERRMNNRTGGKRERLMKY